jgi:uncharacterized cupredoxin-like copper-binding protein
MRKISSIFLMVALALSLGFVVVGCGDDDDDESASTGTTTTPSEEAPAPTGKSQGTVDVSLTEYKVTLDKGDISKPGVYTLNVTNDGTITHALEAEGPDGETETEDLAAGDSAELEVNFENGSYELYCPIGNHRDLGMTTDVDVSG